MIVALENKKFSEAQSSEYYKGDIFMAMVVLDVVRVVLSIIVYVSIFLNTKQMWNKLIRLGLTSSITIIYIIQIPMRIQLQEECIEHIVLTILWFIVSLMFAVDVGQNRNKK